MFKRANKITSLLVTAAAVMSLVPAYAADVKKIDSEDGTVYSAVAYKDGKFYVDGEINDEEGAYYVSDGKFNELDDVDSGDDITQYGEKYLDVNDGDYTVDLSSGSVSDDDIIDDTTDDAATSLRKKLKNDDADDRYTSAIDTVKTDSELTLVPGAKFAAPWYYTTYTNKEATNGLTAGNGDLNVFTDTEGNYIDADYNLGKVKVTTTNGSVDIKNTDDTYDINGQDDVASASVEQLKVLAQDSDYIYRLVKVTVKVDDSTGKVGGIQKINGKTVGGSTVLNQVSDTEVNFPAIQKISKAQSSGEVDGAKYAKNVTTYALSADDATELDAQDLFLNSDGSANDDTKYTVAGGKLIAYAPSASNENVIVRAYTLKSSSSYYYADEEDQSKEDAEVSAQDKTTVAVDVDADGNLWRLDGGYIYKFDNTDDWDKVYKVDGAFDELSVYDADNMAAWSEDDEVYSLIGGKSTDKDDTDSDDDTNKDDTTTQKANGWVQAADGTWSYNTNGVKSTGWYQVGGVWYYSDATGTMQTGWANVNGTWYYLNASGAMATGWTNVGGTWYYLNGSGAMQTGWLNDNGTWYYLNASGAMLSNTTVDGYVLGANGAWVK